jgi:hypothetical protein
MTLQQMAHSTCSLLLLLIASDHVWQIFAWLEAPGCLQEHSITAAVTAASQSSASVV